VLDRGRGGLVSVLPAMVFEHGTGREGAGADRLAARLEQR
jgi:hypothetical protein